MDAGTYLPCRVTSQTLAQNTNVLKEAHEAKGRPRVEAGKTETTLAAMDTQSEGGSIVRG